MNKSIANLTILLLIGLGLAASVRGEALTNAVIVPVKFSHGRVVIPARLNGSDPLTFLLDSACTIPTLHPSLLEKLTLEQSGHVTINGIAGEERAPTYRGVIFDLKGASYSPHRVAVVPSEAEQRRRTDGVLGSGFLRRFVVEIDPSAKQIHLYSPTNFLYSGKGEILPFRFKSEIPVVKASIVFGDDPPIEGEFEIDTGCDSGLCLGSAFVQRNKLLDQIKTRSDEKFGIGGSVETKSGTLPLLRLGNLEVRNSQTDLFMKGSPVDDPLAGHIGMGILHHYKVIFDYSRKQLIIER